MKNAEIRKRQIMLDYARRFRLTAFVETGIYKGDTIKAMLASNLFTVIHSVDIYEDRYTNAKVRFSKFPQVHCWHGDSADMIAHMIEAIDVPTLFWLDAHHSGKQIARVKGLIETPIVRELDTVLKQRMARHSVILIDDARYYVEFAAKYANYPSLDRLQGMVVDALPNAVWQVEDDIIRVYHADCETVG